MEYLNTIIAIACVHAFYLAVLVLSKRSKSISDKLLIIFLLIMSFMYGATYSAFEFNMSYFNMINLIDFFIAPCIYIYVLSLINKNFKLNHSALLHFIPFLIMEMLFIHVLYRYTREEIIEIVHRFDFYNYPTVIFWYIVSYLGILIIPTYLFLVLTKLRKHKQNIEKTFSYSENIDLVWVKKLSILMGLEWIAVYGSFFFISRGENADNIRIGFAASSIIIFFIGYHGFKQKQIYPTQSSFKNESSSKYKKSQIRKDIAEKYLRTIMDHIENKKVFLNNTLTLFELSTETKISQHHISQILNNELNETFYSFINKYRVEYFKKQIKQNTKKNLSILGIAMESGFNSKSSFNRIFKDATGLTPSQYVAQIRAKNEKTITSSDKL